MLNPGFRQSGLHSESFPKLQLDPLASIEYLPCGNDKLASEKGDRDGAQAGEAEAEADEASNCQRPWPVSAVACCIWPADLL